MTTLDTKTIFASVTRAFGCPTSEHLWPLADVMVRAATTTDPTRAFVVSAPPRHGKTALLTHAMAVAIRANPKLRIGYATYSSAQASNVAREVAGLVAPYVDILANSESRSDWSTSEGGGLYVFGAGSGLVGRGFDVMVIDSPFKNGPEARDPQNQERVWEWYQDVVLTRIEGDGSIVVAGERWSRGDLHGRILAKRTVVASDGRSPIEHINLPALSPNGTALWPERFSLGDLAQTLLDIGEESFTALYQGEPTR